MTHTTLIIENDYVRRNQLPIEILAGNTPQEYYGKPATGLIDVLNTIESEKTVDGGISISLRNVDDLLDKRPDWVFETIRRRIGKSRFDVGDPEERHIMLKLINYLQTRRDYEKIRAIYPTVAGSWRSCIDAFLENVAKLFGTLSLTASFGFDLIEWHLDKTGEYFGKQRAVYMRNKLR